jgi:hypothetical protein
MNQGGNPWLTLHDKPNGLVRDEGTPGRDGSAPSGVGAGVSAAANATGPTPAAAQVTPATAVKRFSETSMSTVSFCRETGVTGGFDADAKLAGFPAFGG